jgi:hypothetical protein
MPCLLSRVDDSVKRSAKNQRQTQYTVEAVSLDSAHSWIGINQCLVVRCGCCHVSAQQEAGSHDIVCDMMLHAAEGVPCVSLCETCPPPVLGTVYSSPVEYSPVRERGNMPQYYAVMR